MHLQYVQLFFNKDLKTPRFKKRSKNPIFNNFKHPTNEMLEQLRVSVEPYFFNKINIKSNQTKVAENIHQINSTQHKNIAKVKQKRSEIQKEYTSKAQQPLPTFLY